MQLFANGFLIFYEERVLCTHFPNVFSPLRTRHSFRIIYHVRVYMYIGTVNISVQCYMRTYRICIISLTDENNKLSTLHTRAYYNILYLYIAGRGIQRYYGY